MTDFFFENFSDVIIGIGIFTYFSFYLLYRKDLKKIYNSKVLFLSVFLFFLYWIPQGFDITDEGYVLTKSWFMLHGAWHQNVDMIWGSSLFNGLWLSILSTPNLLWARIGFAIITALNSLLVFQIIRLYFPVKETFLFVLGLSLFIPFGSPQTINYQNVPTIFILLSFMFFLKGNKHNTGSLIVLSGFLIFTAVMFKFPLIVFLPFPFIYYALEYIFFKKSIKIKFKYSILSLGGIIGGILFFVFILYLSDSLTNYVAAVSGKFQNAEKFDSTHSMSHLFMVYKNDLILIFERILLALAFIFSAGFFSRFFKKKVYKTSFVLLFGFVLILYALKVRVYYNWIYTILGFELAALIVFFIFSFKYSGKYFALYFFAIYMFFFSFTGSDIGFRLNMWSGSEVFFGSVFLLLLYFTEVKTDAFKLNFKSLIISFFLFLFILFVKIKPDYIYRDQTRKNLSHTFKSVGLKGIKSIKERVEVTDSLLSFLNSEIKEKDKLFVTGTIPMFYFLTNKKPVLQNLWIQDKDDFKNYLKENNLPDYFLFPVKNPRNPAWPVKSSVIRKTDSINLVYYKSFIMSNTYKNIYRNSMFEVFKKNTEISD